jgi:small subunit ribosomal protein S2e
LAEQPQREGGFQRGPGGPKRGPGGPGGPKRGPRQNKEESKEWQPFTKLGRLVKANKIQSLEEIYLHSLPIKEFQIIDHFYPAGALKEEVMKISPVQKQSAAGQCTRFRAVIAIGDENGHVGLGAKVAKEVATAIRGAIIAAKLSLVPVRRGYWGNKIGEPHTVPMKITGKCGSVRVRLIPAPRGTQIVAAPASKRMIQLAGLQDCFTCADGHTKTKGNFVRATFDALARTYQYLTPDLWAVQTPPKQLYAEFSDLLSQTKHKRAVAPRQ